MQYWCNGGFSFTITTVSSRASTSSSKISLDFNFGDPLSLPTSVSWPPNFENLYCPGWSVEYFSAYSFIERKLMDLEPFNVLSPYPTDASSYTYFYVVNKLLPLLGLISLDCYKSFVGFSSVI